MRFVPDTGLLEWATSSEAQVRDALVGLDDSWTCLHHVRYRVPPSLRQSMRRREWGEADFILLHAEHGLVGIEAKGGQYEWDAAGFRSATSGASMTDPIDQALTTRTFVRKEAKRIFNAEHIPYSLLAAFPDMVVPSGFGPHGYERNIFDGTVFENDRTFRTRLERFIVDEQIQWRYPERERLRILRALEKLLAPTTTVRPLASQVSTSLLRQASATSAAFALHREQVSVLREQQLHRRTYTTGPAGTGKSLLAVETARSLASQGFRVLFFTPNSLQGTDTVRLLSESGELYDGNGVPTHEDDAGVHVEYLSTRSRSADDTQRAATALADALLDRFDDACFDALVIDEYQDVTSDLDAALRSLVVGEADGLGEFHAFGDPKQRSIREDSASSPSGYTPLALTTVCRNSSAIHRLVSAILPRPGAPKFIAGPDPEIIGIDNADGAIDAVTSGFHRFVSDGIPTGAIQIVVAFSPDSAWGDRVLDGVRRQLRNVKPTPSLPIAVDNFKGMEADVVIVATGAATLDGAAVRELYVGASRARGHLLFVCPHSLARGLSSSSSV